MSDYTNIEDLVAKCLAGEASPAEMQAVYKWLLISGENRKYYADMQKIFDISEDKAIKDDAIISEKWEVFSKRLKKQKGEKTVIKKMFFSLCSKAAVIILLITVGYFIYKSKTPAEKEIILSFDQNNQFNQTLPDGTIISSDPKSAISYSSYFNAKNREVKLTGQAYFKVRHDQNLPFIVHTGDVFIMDIGTAFRIKSIPSDSVVEVYVEEGEVYFYSEHDSGLKLVQNEKGIYNTVSKTFRKQSVADDSVSLDSNQVQVINFESTTLHAVVDTLNRIYHTNIVLSCEKLDTMRLTATFKETTLKPILETIAGTFDLAINKKDKIISLESKTCNH